MRKLAALGIVICAAILLLLGHEALVLFLSVLLTYFILDNCLSVKLFNSIFIRGILAIFAYFAILQSVIMTSWIISHNFPLNYCMELTLLLLVFSLGWLAYIRRKEQGPIKLSAIVIIKSSDIYSVLVALVIIFLVIGGPVVKSWHAFNHHIQISSVVVDYIDTSLDDSNHLSRINDRIQLNRGVLYKTNVTKYVVHGDSISTYPPAWHSANALVIKSLDQKISVGGQSTIAYAATKLIWTFIMVYLFCRVAFMLEESVTKRQKRVNKLVGNLFIFGATLFLAYYTLLEQFQEGFYTFIPLIISLMLLIPLLVQLREDKSTKLNNKYRTILPLTLIIVNLTLSWLLLMPSIILAIIVVLLWPTKDADIRANFIGLSKKSLTYIPILLFSVLSIIVQLVIITAPSSQSFSVGVNTPGAIVAHSVSYFVFVSLGISLIFFISKQLAILTQYVAALLVSLLGFSLFVYIFQVLTVHSPQYYYYKTLDAFIICATPLAIIGWLKLVNVIADRFDFLTLLIVVFGSLIALPLIIGVYPPNDALFTYIHGSRSIDPVESSYIYNSINSRGMTPINNRTTDVIMFEPGDLGHNIVGTNILRSTQPISGCDDAQFTDLLNDNQNSLLDTISKCQKTPLIIVTRKDSFNSLSQAAIKYNLGSNIHIVSVD